MKIIRYQGSGIAVKFSSDVLEKVWNDIKRIRRKMSFEEAVCSNSFLYVAKEKGVIVGFLYAYVVSRSGELTYHSTAILESLFVDPKYQNQGIATSLLETFLDVCYNHNIKMIETEKFHENEYMNALYWKLNLRKYCYRMRISFEKEKV